MANVQVRVHWGPNSAGKSVQVNVHKTGAAASLFNSGGSGVANPVTVDSGGYVNFFAAEQTVYDLVEGSHGMQVTTGAVTAPGTVVTPAGPTTPLINPVSVTAAYTASDHDVVLANATSGALPVTLPTPTNGAHIMVKKTDVSANAVAVNRSGTATIDGATTVSLASQWAHTELIGDGTNWFVVT